MASYQHVSIEWLLALYANGYIAQLDGDKQELLNAVFEN